MGKLFFSRGGGERKCVRTKCAESDQQQGIPLQRNCMTNYRNCRLKGWDYPPANRWYFATNRIALESERERERGIKKERERARKKERKKERGK